MMWAKIKESVERTAPAYSNVVIKDNMVKITAGYDYGFDIHNLDEIKMTVEGEGYSLIYWEVDTYRKDIVEVTISFKKDGE